ncbi:hypothetical protein D3C84_1070170 [compost metagenome]
MDELAPEGRHEIMKDFGGAYGEELVDDATGKDIQQQINSAVDEQYPHRRKMPQQCAGQPTTQGNAVGNPEEKNRRGVIDTPAAHHQDDHRDDVDPVGQP